MQFKATLELSPDDMEVRYDLGRVLFYLGRDTEAIPLFESALQARSSDPQAHLLLDHALERSGRKQRPFAAMRKPSDLRRNWSQPDKG